jgi:hypothetical protein
MALDTSFILKQIDPVLQRYSQGLSKSKYDDLSDLPDQEAYMIATLMAAAVDRLASPKSRYILEPNDAKEARLGSRLAILAGILRALKSIIWLVIFNQ